jgi:hypothetical protein
MTNSSLTTLLFLISGISNDFPTDSSTKTNKILVILADDLRTNFEPYGVIVARPNLTQINQSLMRLNFQI